MRCLRGPGPSAAYAAALLLGACAAPPEPIVVPEWEAGALAPLHVLSGRWVGINDEGVATEESWTDPAAGAMFGVNRTISGGETVFYEFLRIEVEDDGTIVYRAQPRGRAPATPFALTEQSENRFVFSNPQHDFPQRIIYAVVERDELTMTIEGESAPPSTWRLRRMRAEP